MPKSFSLPNTRASNDGPQIAVIIPCRDEAATIAKVVTDFRRALPEAAIYVCDNNSMDGSADLAKAAGAQVFAERLPGKGHVMRRMFSDVEADVYFMVDGDDTYDHRGARDLMRHLEANSLDMVIGARVAASDAAYRPGHRFGNVLLTRIVAFIFGNQVTDMLSGYRVFSRRFVKSFPALSTGFEIETELTIHALELRMPIDEVPLPYADRPEDSSSKLNTFRDGWRILRTILLLAKEEKPLAFFSTIFGILSLTATVLAWPLFVTFLETGLVPRFPTAILVTGIMVLAFLSLGCGIILDTVTRGRRELRRLQYLGIPRSRSNIDADPQTQQDAAPLVKSSG